jgi:protein-S-isoprenylcysteine O-methyltransferase Ste14
MPREAIMPVLAKLVGVVLMGAAAFGAAGTLDWARGWTFLALWAVASVFPDLALAQANPALLRRRFRAPRTGPRYERLLWVAYVPLILLVPALAGLDVHRFAWTDSPTQLVYAGTLLVLLGGVVSAWAMVENPHYEPAMRIQRDVGHKVIYNGPYRVVRHPGYLAAVIQTAGAPLVLGSVWAIGPVLGVTALLLLRAWLEDRALTADLKGYIAYARQVPTLIFPGVW